MLGRKIGMRGAMDLVASAGRVYVLTEHCAKDGSPKLVKRCTLLLTKVAACDVVITERALFGSSLGTGFVLKEVACGFTLDDILTATALEFAVSKDVRLEAYGPSVWAAR